MSDNGKSENTGYKIGVPVEYVFKPKADITAFELAQILEDFNLKMGEDVYKEWPEESKRHWEKS